MNKHQIEIEAGLATKQGYEAGELSWTYSDSRLDEHDNRTGSWHSVGKMSLADAVSYVASEVYPDEEPGEWSGNSVL